MSYSFPASKLKFTRGTLALQAREEEMENDSRKNVIEKMFEAALKERLSLLARKYDPELLFEIWTRIMIG
jgi:hypothetical protein